MTLSDSNLHRDITYYKMSTSAEPKKELSAFEILDKAAQSAMRGGAAGAVAMGLNVGALMWMRTTVRHMNIICSVLGAIVMLIIIIAHFRSALSIPRSTINTDTAHRFPWHYEHSMPMVAFYVSTAVFFPH